MLGMVVNWLYFLDQMLPGKISQTDLMLVVNFLKEKSQKQCLPIRPETSFISGLAFPSAMYVPVWPSLCLCLSGPPSAPSSWRGQRPPQPCVPCDSRRQGLVPAPRARLSPQRPLGHCRQPARRGWLLSRVPVWPSGRGERPSLVGASVAGWEAACGESRAEGRAGAARAASRLGECALWAAAV